MRSNKPDIAACIMYVLGSILVLLFMAATAFGQNYRVHGPPGESVRAKQIADRCEECRREIAIAFFGKALPDEPARIPVYWQNWTHETGGGGSTSYHGSHITHKLQGSFDKVMNDVIPHEICHQVVYRGLGGYHLPLWMNEGIASTCESDEEITRRENKLQECLRTGRGIPVKRLMMMERYPAEMWPYYFQSTSLARFLIGQGGLDKFLDLDRQHRRSNSWTQSIADVYGYPTLTDLQRDWVRWIDSGSPDEVRVMKPIPRSQAPYRPTAAGGYRASTATTGFVRAAPGSLCDGNGNCSPSGTVSPLPRPTPTPLPGNSGRSCNCSSVDIGEQIRIHVETYLRENPPAAGPIGPEGPQGPQGLTGNTGAEGKLTDEQLGIIVAKLLAKMKEDDAFRGPAGPPREIGGEELEKLAKRVAISVKFDEDRIREIVNEVRPPTKLIYTDRDNIETTSTEDENGFLKLRFRKP